LELVSAFNLQVSVPEINNKKDLLNIMANMEGKESDKEKIADMIGECAIKKLLMMLDMTRQLSGGSLIFSDFCTAYQYYNSK